MKAELGDKLTDDFSFKISINDKPTEAFYDYVMERYTGENSTFPIAISQKASSALQTTASCFKLNHSHILQIMKVKKI